MFNKLKGAYKKSHRPPVLVAVTFTWVSLGVYQWYTGWWIFKKFNQSSLEDYTVQLHQKHDKALDQRMAALEKYQEKKLAELNASRNKE